MKQNMDPSTFFIVLLQILFIGLKLGDVVDWNWFVVFMPLIGIMIWYVFMLLIIILVGIFYKPKKEEHPDELMRRVNEQIEKNKQQKNEQQK